MIFKNYTYNIVLLAGFCIANISLPAQTVGIRTDKSQILIGERIEYELLITLPAPGYFINFNLPDSVSHFEAIEKGNFDTTNTNGSVSLHRKIIFTSFDSGSWYIPPFPVTLEKNNNSQKIMTDSVLINVGYAPADTTNELRDIKPIIEVNERNYFWYYVAAAVLLGLLITIILFGYFKNKKPKPTPVLHSALSPYDEAMKDLSGLSIYSLDLPADVKQYHTQLGFILKKYYSRITDYNLLNKTTDGFLLRMKEQQQETTLISSVAEALRMGDAVKFAKYIPTAPESINSVSRVKHAIEKLEKTKPNKN